MGTKDSFTILLASVPCSCGGVLRPFELRGEYDASVELGIPAKVTGTLMLLKCDRCGKLSLAGGMLDAISDDAVSSLLKLDRRLSGAEARFLRKAALGLGQAELAGLLGLTRVTVARWEGEQSLSAQHDFELRGLVVGRLYKKASGPGGRWKGRRAELTSLMASVLEAARTAKAPARPPPLELAA